MTSMASKTLLVSECFDLLSFESEAFKGKTNFIFIRFYHVVHIKIMVFKYPKIFSTGMAKTVNWDG